MTLGMAVKNATLMLSTLLLTGCVIVQNLRLAAEGFEWQRSHASASVYKMDNTPRYNKKVNYIVKVDDNYRYISYVIDVGHALAGFPTVFMEDYDVTIEKLNMFIRWANEPYDVRKKNILEVQNSLPQNSQTPGKGITDFYLFMAPEVNNNTPYLAYNRDTGVFSSERFLISKQDAEIIIYELMAWKADSEEKKKNSTTK